VRSLPQSLDQKVYDRMGDRDDGFVIAVDF